VVARYSQTQNIDEPLAMLRSAGTNFYEADGLGSATSLTNANGTLAQTYTFDSFGKQTVSSGSLANPFQYTGRESDAETGLHYYRARYYDHTAGRFLSEDPTRFGEGVNFYGYVFNNPVNSLDPLGLATTSWHYSITYNLGKQIFGPKCEPVARAIAAADAAVDDNGGVVGSGFLPSRDRDGISLGLTSLIQGWSREASHKRLIPAIKEI